MSSGRIPAAGRLVLVSGESAARADSPQSGAGRRSVETLQPSHYLTSPHTLDTTCGSAAQQLSSDRKVDAGRQKCSAVARVLELTRKRGALRGK